MNKSNFIIHCPGCTQAINLVDDCWDDDLLSDASDTEIHCPYCKISIQVTTNATYTFDIAEEEPTHEN